MHRVLNIAVLLALAAAAPARAGDEITDPDWLRRPTAEDLRGVWPADALRRGLGGRATISCAVNAQGLLHDCTVVSEDPPGSGFGAAAIALTPQFAMRPMTRNGVAVDGGRVRIPIAFVSHGEAPGDPGRAILDGAMAWEKAPTYADVIAAYPAKARAAGVGGSVGLRCRFTYLRTLQWCEVLREDPAGYGFGDAAKAIARKFVAFPARPNGKALSDALAQLQVTFTPDMLKGAKPAAGKPRWVETPTGEAIQAAFAQAAPPDGTIRVELRCDVQQGGALSDCAVAGEEPPGKGYGAAALGLAKDFRLGTWSSEGLPVVGGEVSIPLRYEVAP